jgi:chaperonin GroEL (HSP60 family)
MSGESSEQPVVVLQSETAITDGTAVQQKLIGAARTLQNLLKATLGPRGLDKMLYKTDGTTAVTNDGAKVVAELMVKHPAAKAFQSLAAAQESACGDGVTSTLLFCGELLTESERLLRLGLHPSIIVAGLQSALSATLAAAGDIEIRFEENSDNEYLLDVARTALSGRAASAAHEHCARLAADALESVVPKSDGQAQQTVRAEDVTMHLAGRGDIRESRLVKGVIIRRRIIMDRMLTSLANPKIAIFSTPLAIREMSRDAEIEVADADTLGAFIDAEHQMREDLAKILLESGANAFFCKGEVDRDLQHLLIDADCFVAGELDESELVNLAAATGARMCGAPNTLEVSDIGEAGYIEARHKPASERVEDEIEVGGCVKPAVVTIVVHGSNQTASEEVIRGLYDALRATALASETRLLLPGAGSSHAKLAAAVRLAATKESGRERLAYGAFASALEIIPVTLIENSGNDALDGMLALRTEIATATVQEIAQTSNEDKLTPGEGERLNGQFDRVIGVRENGQIGEVSGIWHASKTILHGIEAATETACSMLRIDQVISARGD